MLESALNENNVVGWFLASSLERVVQPQPCVSVPKWVFPGAKSGCEGKPPFCSCLIYKIGPQNLPSSPLNTAYPSLPHQVPWAVLPGRGSRGSLKSMPVENAVPLRKQSSTSCLWSIPPPRGNRGRTCTARTEAALSLGDTAPSWESREQTFKRQKLSHMVPPWQFLSSILAPGRNKIIFAEG